MARVNLLSPEELTGKAKEAYDDLNSRGKITNMKLVMLQDYGTYLAFMGWYDSWESLVNIVAVRSEDKDNEAIAKLVKVLQGPEISKFIAETYDGAVVPLN